MSEKSKGVVYAATGTKAVELFEISVARLREVEPDLNIAVFTDQAQAERIENLKIKNCDVRILEEPTFSYFDKTLALQRTPFDKAIFLDADTLAVRPFSEELFEALEYSPILARSAGIGFNYEWEYTDYPAAIPQFNTGVIAYKFPDTYKIFEILARSSTDVDSKKAVDQPFFRAACIDANKVPAELPAQYNFQDNDMAVFPVRIRHCIRTKDVMLDAAKREKHLQLLTTMQTPCRIYKDRLAYVNKGFTETFVLALLLEMIPQRIRKLRKSLKKSIRRITGKTPEQPKRRA